MIGTVKKLSYEKKLGLYFSLLTSLVLKYFQIRVSSVTTSVLSTCQMFVECADNP